MEKGHCYLQSLIIKSWLLCCIVLFLLYVIYCYQDFVVDVETIEEYDGKKRQLGKLDILNPIYYSAGLASALTRSRPWPLCGFVHVAAT